MKTLLAAATIIAGLALAPAALAGNSTGHTAQSDTSTALPNPYQNTGSASAALQGYTTSGPGTGKLLPLGGSHNTMQ